MTDVDVCVLGAGAAGLAAALEAADAGCSVLVLEAAAEPGGSTQLSGGVIYAAGTSVQRAAGIVDQWQAMYERYLDVNRWDVEPGLALALAKGAAEAIEWLRSMGLEFELIINSPVETIRRGHKTVGLGARLAEVLIDQVSDRDIEIRCHQRVDGLTVDTDGTVVGVTSGDDEIAAGAVVLATGGFGQSREMIDRHLPSIAAHGEVVWSVSAPTCVGDGLHLGEMVGAGIVGHDRALALITPGFGPFFDVVPPAWLVYVNRDGQRFVDEKNPYGVTSTLVAGQPGGSAFAVLDADTFAFANPGTPSHQGGPSPNWNNRALDEHLASGQVKRADTLRGLAEQLGVDADGFEATMAVFNDDCARGEDRRFGKDPAWMRPVERGPFYGAEIYPAMIALTACGVRIDPDARALTPAGQAIEGLFAAGETTGGPMGAQYAGSGSSIANSLVFGRIAGRSAAAAATHQPLRAS